MMAILLVETYQFVGVVFVFVIFYFFNNLVIYS